jgi:hypothetical protein
MAKVIDEWVKVARLSLEFLFSGDEAGINALTNLIKDGKMISGAQTEGVDSGRSVPSDPSESTTRSLTDSVAKAFFSYATPAIWTLSGAFPFVVDSGIACGTANPSVMHLTDETRRASETCYKGHLYYLAGITGVYTTCYEGGCLDNDFSTLHGMEALSAGSFGGVTAADLIIG